jgi:uncharacterized membrane protein YheB (UPF0754 family)
VRLGEWLRSPGAETHLQEFVGDNRARLEQYLRTYISRKIPQVASRLFDSGEVWGVVEKQILPAARKFATSYLRREGKEAIIRQLALSRRIEESVAKQDVRQFHRMVNSAAAEYLGAIQILGYFLGALAGLLLAGTSPFSPSS